jgi:uncharacterized protein
MLLGILADTHDELARTQRAIEIMREAGAEALIHCGDLTGSPIVAVCSALPLWFVFGNHDADSVPELQRASAQFGAACLGWGGVIDLAGKHIGVAHGHLTTDVRRVPAERPDFLLTGHAHFASDEIVGGTRRICPGALHRADEFTVALLDLPVGGTRVVRIDGE